MAVALPRHMGMQQPLYIEQMYLHRELPGSPVESASSLHSAKSSFSCSSGSSYDLRAAYNASRPLTPYDEEGHDISSIRSKRSVFSFRRFRMPFRTNRKGHDHGRAAEMIAQPVISKLPPPMSSSTLSLARRPSLPMLQTDFPPPRGVSTYARKPLPAVPRPTAQEVSCRPCYYFAARHCNGWVMGGTSGDSCEMCLSSGFFGAK